MWFDRVGEMGKMGQKQTPNPQTTVRDVWSSLAMVAVILVAISFVGPSAADDAAKYNEKAMALYADAANFQTNGATDLAIEGWVRYLKKYPDEPYASKAAHYLGVCYMQSTPPNFLAAVDAFGLAVKDPNLELRSESLVNLGWCQYASAGEGEQQDAIKLQASQETFETFLKEDPNSKFADRAMFYAGEASYALGDPTKAVRFYDRLIAMETAKDSPLRCDTYYARGVALADMKKYDDAIKSFQQLIGGCKDNALIVDAKIRMGDVLILQENHDTAASVFADVASGKSDEVPYALVRQAYSLVKLSKPDQAAALYERLLTEFPESPFTAAATLASAQSVYRAGDMDEATKRFTRVLGQKDSASATEAAHWLATISLRKGNAEAALAVAEKQIAAGATGEYASTLRMDLAEAMMLIPGKTEDAQKLFVSVYQDAPDGSQGSRALYNAAFAAMQLMKTDDAISLADEFLNRFKESPLAPDVRYVIAESKLMSADFAGAAQAYRSLLNDDATKANAQRPLWVLRAGMAAYSAKEFDDAIDLLSRDVPADAPASQVAEAKYIIGASHLAAARPSDAVRSLQESLAADPAWLKSDEAMLLLGQSMMNAGDEVEAVKTWEQLAAKYPNSPRHDVAMYSIAQSMAKKGEHEAAAGRYASVISSGKQPSLLPFSLYGQGWNLLQCGKPDAAIDPLSRVTKDFPKHPIAVDAKLALGISLRSLGKLDESTVQLQSVLDDLPIVAPDPGDATVEPPKVNINRGHALYELALIDQQQKRPREAAERLERLVSTVPNYPGMDKVIYELGWSLKESGQDDEAEKAFTKLIDQYPDDPITAEAYYFLGQRRYVQDDWEKAKQWFQNAARLTTNKDLLEKSLYRLGWSGFKAAKFDDSRQAFSRQVTEFPDGSLVADGLLMVGECDFRQGRFDAALVAYQAARKRIEEKDENAKTLAEGPERQIRELVYLHGGQSAGQSKDWPDAIKWFNALRLRFPETVYLPQALYETGFAYQQQGNDDEALKYFANVAAEYRTETAARARFMIGEIYFAKRDLAKAITEFQRVMYGYGAEKASDEIKNWQAKSGYEAGRCAELLIQATNDAAKQAQSATIAKGFFTFVAEKHPKHELASKSRERLDVLNRTNPKPGQTNRSGLPAKAERSKVAN